MRLADSRLPAEAGAPAQNWRYRLVNENAILPG
jgi:hypothetical protein